MVKKILMVCVANICPSPIAEAVTQNLIDKRGLSEEWQVESAGIKDEFQGYPPDRRAQSVMQKYGISYAKYARQVNEQDFNEFDYILGMDDKIMDDLTRIAPPVSKAKILLLGNFGLKKEDRIIVDPYYQSGDDGFEKAYQQCVVACDAFLKAEEAGTI